MFSNIDRYESVLPQVAPVSLDELDKQLRIYYDDILEVWYSPHGVASSSPKLWVLGITPGWNQMRIAYEDAAVAIQQGLSRQEAARSAKPRVAFAGSMRTNLIAMMDELGLATALELSSSADLFGAELLRTGSVLKYPVFTRGKNYTGYSPKPHAHSVLCEMLDTVFATELESIVDCLILPLGKTVESVLDHFVAMGLLDGARVLRGFPHPSGANGHRQKIFLQNKVQMRRAVAHWFRG